MIETRLCARCRKVLVDEDELGWYYQVPVEENFGPLYPGGPDTMMTFMDRVHECDGKPHLVIAREPAAKQIRG